MSSDTCVAMETAQHLGGGNNKVDDVVSDGSYKLSVCVCVCLTFHCDSADFKVKHETGKFHVVKVWTELRFVKDVTTQRVCVCV